MQKALYLLEVITEISNRGFSHVIHRSITSVEFASSPGRRCPRIVRTAEPASRTHLCRHGLGSPICLGRRALTERPSQKIANHEPPPTALFVESLSCSVKVPQRWQRNERFQWAYRSRAANDIFPARGMNLSRFLGRSRFQGGCLR